jgi:SAM-dependent methyltransferase
MNERHLQICSSAEWAETVRNEILPWALGQRELGDDVLEVGPGPGQTTDVLRTRTPHLTAVEVDESLATKLAARLQDTNVDVIHADGTALPFDDDRFSAATSFTMLHHVPSPQAQDQLFKELCRVLRPGGVLIGVDSIPNPEWLETHIGDTCVPVDPATLGARLQSAGFVDVEVQRSSPEPSRRFRFAARVPVTT